MVHCRSKNWPGDYTVVQGMQLFSALERMQQYKFIVWQMTCTYRCIKLEQIYLLHILFAFTLAIISVAKTLRTAIFTCILPRPCTPATCTQSHPQPPTPKSASSSQISPCREILACGVFKAPEFLRPDEERANTSTTSPRKSNLSQMVDV
jgi:hypothetical protein